MEKIKTGIIGTGFIGPAHIEALRRLGNVEIAALADVDQRTAESKAAALGVPSAFGNWRDLLNENLDVVHICSPNFLHYEMAKAALLAGKHVVCEKPLTLTIPEAEELVLLAEKKQLINVVHFNIRYYPLMRQLKEMIKKGEFGEVFAIHGSYLQDWLFYNTDYNWRLEPEMSGKSRAVADIGSHWMDLVEYVTGDRISEVCADFATFHKTRKKPLKPVETYAGKILKPDDYKDVEIKTEDYATVMLRFENGARGALTVNQVAAGRKNRCSFEINGSRLGAFWESELPNQMWIGRRGGNNELMLRDQALVHEEVRSLVDFPGGHNEGFPDTSKQMFREVYAAVKKGVMPDSYDFPDFKSGLRELVLNEKIVQSAEKRCWIKI